MSQTAPIGIFDSGIGGLTVFRAIRRLLPQESLLYVGDTARVPYGNKTAETVTAYSLQIAHYLMEQGIKALVVACNTSSAVALPALQAAINVPVIGMIAPGTHAALRTTRSEKIGVIGTRRTILSGAYEKDIRAQAPQAQIISQDCPLFVPLVEEGWLSGLVTHAVAERYLAPLKHAGVDTVILGCTHYPLLKPVIQEIMGPDVTLIDSGEAAALEVLSTLEERDLLASPETQPEWRCFVTDVVSPFADIAHRFLEDPLPTIQTLFLTSHTERVG